MELGIRDPFIAENGAAIYFPASYRNFLIENGAAVRPPYLVIVLGRPYGEIRRFLDILKRRFPLQGFGDLSTEDVARLTGLPAEKPAGPGSVSTRSPLCSMTRAVSAKLKNLRNGRV